MAEFLRKLDRVLHRIMLVIAQIAIAAMVIIVTMTAILRKLGTGIGWAEEVPRLLVGLFAFLAMSMGVRDHLHVSVGVIYNRFKKDGKAQKFLDFLYDFIILLCGIFMLWFGATRFIKLYPLPGKLPMTGIDNSFQYLPIPIAGFMIVLDSILFLTGVNKHDDLLFEDKEDIVEGKVNS